METKDRRVAWERGGVKKRAGQGVRHQGGGPSERRVSVREGPPAPTAPTWGTRWPWARGTQGHSTRGVHPPWRVILLGGLQGEMLGYNHMMGNFMLHPCYESGQRKHKTAGESGPAAAVLPHPSLPWGSMAAP